MKKTLLLLGSMLMIIFVLSIVQVIASNRLSTTGLTLGKLQDEIHRYKTENAMLRETVLEASSLTHIASAAGTLGFVEAKTHVYVGAPQPIAVQR